MKRVLRILLSSLIIPLSAWSQANEDYLKLVWDSHLPDDLFAFYSQEVIRSKYEINKSLNPFYLRGDFDGDKRIDYALAVLENGTKKKGILIYHPVSKKYFLVGAGKSIPNGHGDDYPWMDSWEVYDRKEVDLGVGETKSIKLKGEAIVIQKLESSSGLVYWDGKEYRWYQQGD